MPKIKTNKAAKKRFHITGSGKVMRTKGPKSHLRRKRPKELKDFLEVRLNYLLQ